MRKVEFKLYLTPELADQVVETTARFRSAGRQVSRNEVLEQLIGDGFRLWRRETEVISRVEASIAGLIDQSARQAPAAALDPADPGRWGLGGVPPGDRNHREGGIECGLNR